MHRPLYAIVSTDIRRDLVAPMRYFRRLRLVHCYRRASYDDMSPDEVDAHLVAYRSPWHLFRLLYRLRPDAVQGVEPFAIRLLPFLYAVYFVSLLRRLPLVVVTLENRPLAVKHGLFFAWLLRAALRPVFGQAAAIVYLNEGAQQNVLSTGPYHSKLRRLMYGTWGVDPDEFTPQRDGREPSLGPGPVVLFVGRLLDEKGIFDLLDAFEIVRQTIPVAQLVLAGAGPKRLDVERRVAASRLEAHVQLVGTIKNRDLPPYFRSAAVFVAPSRSTAHWTEQVGMTNIQAMACGIPVVSTRSGSIPEYVPDGVAGVLVAEGDVPALAKAILRLLGDQHVRRQMGAAGRAYALQHYDARQNVANAQELILSLMKGRQCA